MNNLMTLDGLIQRLTELRDMAGSDCPVVLGKFFDPTKALMKLTMVSLDSIPGEGIQYVAMLAENIQRPPLFMNRKKIERNEVFDVCFELFKRDNPDWENELSDSTYYELAEWYDDFHGKANGDYLSDKSYEFADYVWRKIK